MDISKEHIKQKSGELISLLPDNLEWQPDQRFSAIIAEVPKSEMETVRAALDTYFSTCLDRKTIRSANKILKTEAGIFADMEKHQFLYAASDDSKIMAAWWPWAPGAPASLRLFLPQATPKKSENVIAKFFGIFKGQTA